jgi:hypothetical protein
MLGLGGYRYKSIRTTDAPRHLNETFEARS